MNAVYGVYGASGFGREVLPLARAQLAGRDNTIFFIDDRLSDSVINGVRVLSFHQFNAILADEKYVALAIADPLTRNSLWQKLEECGIRHWTIQATNVVTLDDCVVGEGAILAPFVTLTTNILIGKSFHANIYSYVAHDCEIGDFVSFAPGVMCNGNVKIGDNVYIGSGAIIKQGKPGKPLVIGDGAVIGMGSIITKNVPAEAVVIATPTRPIERKGLGR
jgi:sugar O-acyltransferase (sialic acid O-acetyltransferase NeuD family)